MTAKSTATVVSIRRAKPMPVRVLILRAARAVNTCDELGNIVLINDISTCSDYEVGTLVERLQMQLTDLMQAIHALDKRG